MSKKSNKSSDKVQEPVRSKALLYFAFALTALGAAMLIIPTILIFMPQFELTWDIVFKIPHTYIALCGLGLITTGLIIQRRITPPMEHAEREKLRSRLE
ncbi:MAG: hypothetical protein FK730_13135 [Asgard group archaeon]|nr:hypothetical protein [Asgard group archaeon]